MFEIVLESQVSASLALLSCLKPLGFDRRVAWQDGGTNVFETNTSDRVGIGTTTPNANGSFEILKQSTLKPMMISSTASGGGDYFVVRSDGNVGIGTIEPTDYLNIKYSNTALSGITVTFTNTAIGNLHLNMGITPTQMESGGVTGTGITDDYDNQVRPGPTGSVNGGATAPDLGADEFDGVPLDLTAPTITYTPLSGTCTTTGVTLIASITDASGVPTSGIGLPVLYWKINAGAYTAATGTFVSGNNYSFTFGAGVVVGNTVSYYIVAQDLAATPNVGAFPSAGAGGFTANPPAASTPPTTPSSFTIQSSIGGSFNVGGGQTYTTLTAAIAAYNTSCLTSAVVFNLTDASYTEAAAMTINANPDASAVKTLTIKPTLANTTIAVTGGSTGAIITLNGADYVTINGSISATANTVCPAVAATRDLTITNTNIGTSSAVVWLQTTAGADAATNNKVINCNLVGSGVTQTLFGAGAGSATISTTSLGTANNNNSFVNNNISGVQYGIYTQGASAANKNTGTVINQNLINTSANTKGGIWVGFENSITISANNVSNIAQTTSPDVFGITLGMGTSVSSTTSTGNEVTNATVTKNVIGSVVNSGTFSAVGIAVASAASGTTLLANNMISGVAANGTSGDFAAGIILGGGTGSITNVYYNTVSMQGTITGATAASQTSACLAVTNSTAPTLDLRNNIFSNTQLGNTGATLRFASIALGYSTYATLTSNYNDLYAAGAGPGTYTVGITGTVVAGTNSVTLANWQATTTKDANSVSILPVFTSATDLHLIPVSNAGLNNVGTPVSVTDDIDCTTRDAVTPDIGADEFAPAVITDAGVTAIVMPNPFCPGSNLVSATVKNFGSTTITSILIDWSVTPPGGAQPQVNPGAISIAPGASQTFPLGNFTFAAGTTYTITAFTSLPNGGADGVPGNDSYTDATIKTGLVGTYTVGVGMNYTTLTAAVADYNTRSLCGAVVFSLTDATYTEAAAITINANAAASATNTLTIKPTLANTTIAVTGGSATQILLLNGADYVTINGSISATANTVCPAVAATRDLTITNTNIGTSSAVVWLQTTAGADAATNNKVINCNLVGSGVTQTLFGAGAGSATISTTSLGTANNNNSFVNNNISGVQYGIYTQGASAANKNTGTVINQNLINTSANTKGGIWVGFENSITISANNVSNIAQTTSPDVFGITLGMGTSVSSTTSTGNEVTNATVTKNVIGSVVNSGTFSAVGIAVASAASGTTLLANNMISGVAANGTSGDFAAGIILGGGTGSITNVYYNTVSMQGTITGATAASQTSACLAVTNSTAPTLDLRNNIFSNTQLGNTGATLRFASIALGYSTYATLTSNYNDLYAAGAGPGTYTVGITGTVVAGTNSVTLANWQATTTKDANSVSILPVFTSATDLHLIPVSNAGLNNVGTPVSVTDDIDCTTRDAVTPDIGADEFAPAVITDAGVTAIVMPNPFCPGSNLVSATVKNFGSTTITSILIDWSVTPPGGAQPQVNPGAISIAPGASQTFPLGNFTFAAGTTYTITAFTSLPNGGADGVPGNDSYTDATIKTGLVGTYTVGVGMNYTTLTAAVADYNTRSLCGAVVFSLTDATYTEAAAITINANAAASATNTLTIKPTLANTTIAVTGGSATQILLLNGADYVTIDGSISNTVNTVCPAVAATRDLTITNTNTGTSSAVVWLTHAGTDGANNNTIKNCNIVGNAPATTLLGLGSGGTIGSAATTANNNNNSYINNNISNLQIGIYSAGISAALKNTGTIINKNLINTGAPNTVSQRYSRHIITTY